MAPEIQSNPVSPGSPHSGEVGGVGARALSGLGAEVPARFELPAEASGAKETPPPSAAADADAPAARTVLLRPAPTQSELDFDPPCTLARSIQTSYGRHAAPASRRFNTHA